MEKIIGLGNALVDVLARVDNDDILQAMALPKGSMTLINDDMFLKINEYLLQQNTKLSNGGSAGNAIRALAHLDSCTGFIGKIGNDLYGQFFRKELKKLSI